jgi:shikimate kinase
MNLIFIYGPPATGKFTVGTELAELTGYHLLHNHLAIDIVKDIYPDFNSLPFDLVFKLRLDIFEYAARDKTNLITTFVNDDNEEDKKFVEDVVQTIQRNDGSVLFVQLTAPNEVILQRVSNESRKKLRKLTNVEEMRAMLAKPNINAALEYKDIFTIDTSAQDARTTAEQIAAHFKLLG